MDDAVRRIRRLGRGTALAKFDIASAYRIVPVHPVDRLLLGMVWKGNLYVDGALPFGLRSAPKLFTAVADGLLWIMGRHGITEALHYLDDFLLLGANGSQQCTVALQTSLQLCSGGSRGGGGGNCLCWNAKAIQPKSDPIWNVIAEAVRPMYIRFMGTLPHAQFAIRT